MREYAISYKNLWHICNLVAACQSAVKHCSIPILEYQCGLVVSIKVWYSKGSWYDPTAATNTENKTNN